MIKIVLAAVGIAGSVMACHAQFEGTPQEQAACRPDVRKHCREIKPDAGSGAFLACLQAHRAKLSRACRQILESNGQ